MCYTNVIKISEQVVTLLLVNLLPERDKEIWKTIKFSCLKIKKSAPHGMKNRKNFFSVVDVVAVLTDSIDPAAYWRKLKQRLKKEGNEIVTI